MDLSFVGPGAAIPAADLVILPGSKNTRADLRWLREQGWDQALRRHLRYGGKVIGICGGMQMLGMSVADPHSVEGERGADEGLGLLAIDTELARDKTLRQVAGVCAFADAQAPVEGYEIHMGLTTARGACAPAFLIEGRPEGALSADGQILGTYLHGLFDRPEARAALLAWAGMRAEDAAAAEDPRRLRERSIARMAQTARPLYDALCSLSAPPAWSAVRS